MKSFKKTIALFLSAIMLLTLAPFAFAQTETATDAPANDVDYTITNPYENIDFAVTGYYKGDLHSHTTLSDGNNPLPDMVQRHYELGFDIHAITDHGTTFYGYLENDYLPAMKIIGLVKNGFINGEMLQESGTTPEGNTYKVTIDESKDQYYSETTADGVTGQQMLGVPYGNEQNPTSFNNAHVNSWFVEWGHGRFGGTSDYATPISKINELGGVCVINHPGEYTNARDEESRADAYNKDDLVYNYKITKFESILIKNKACIGIDINSKGDSRTRYDRKLWDILLQDVIPHGRNVFAIATTDAHNLNIVDSGYTMHLMTANTSANLKNNLLNGEFYAASKYIGCQEELVEIRDSLKVTNPVSGAGMLAMLETAIETGEKFYAGEDAVVPKLTGVKVDEAADTITLTTENTVLTRWIANGEVIHIGATIDLDEYSDKIGSYVRAEAYGEGGVMYVQPFVLDYDGAPEASEIKFTDFGYIVTAICDVPVRILLAILPLNLIAMIFG